MNTKTKGNTVLTWVNKAFNVCKTDGGIMAHMVNANGVIIFRWREYYYQPGDIVELKKGEDSPAIYEEVNIPFGVIEDFETFVALCRQFETPGDVRHWYMKKLAGR